MRNHKEIGGGHTMTDNDKLVAFETAISLMLEAQERLSDAEKLFNKCGIELCDTFSWGDAAKERCSFTNAQIHNGIKNFEKLSGTETVRIVNCDGSAQETAQAVRAVVEETLF